MRAVLLVGYEKGDGGSESQQALLAEDLSNRIIVNSIYLNCLSSSSIFKHLVLLYRLTQVALKLPDSIIISLSAVANPYVLIVSTILNRKYFAAIRNQISREEKAFSWVAFFMCFLLPSKFICNHYSYLSGASKFSQLIFKYKRVNVIPNLFSSKYYQISHKISGFSLNQLDPLRILSVGRFHADKNPIAQIKVIQCFLNHGYKIHYTHVGNGPLYDVMRDELEKINSPFFEYSLIRSSHLLSQYYLNSHLLLHTSVYEGTPNVIQEAISVNLPILATYAGDTHLLLSAYRNYSFLDLDNIPMSISNIMHICLNVASPLPRSYFTLHNSLILDQLLSFL